MSAIEAPSLWPTRTGSGAPSCVSTSGRTSSASSWKNAGVRGRGGGSEPPCPKRENATTRRPVASFSRRGEVAPEADRPEALVQEHEDARPVAVPHRRLEPAPPIVMVASTRP